MIETGARLNKKIDAVISAMEQPLGNCVGNSLEVMEAIEFLKGKMAPDLYEITVEIAARTLMLANLVTDYDMAKNYIDDAIMSGRALNKLSEIIEAQGGDKNVIEDYSLFEIGHNTYEIKAEMGGYISRLNALDIAHACKLLGAGRDKKSDKIDFGAGCVLNKKEGDLVKHNETLATLYFNNVSKERLDEAINYAKSAYSITLDRVEKHSVVADI